LITVVTHLGISSILAADLAFVCWKESIWKYLDANNTYQPSPSLIAHDRVLERNNQLVKELHLKPHVRAVTRVFRFTFRLLSEIPNQSREYSPQHSNTTNLLISSRNVSIARFPLGLGAADGGDGD
jgi:hypothetical protein